MSFIQNGIGGGMRAEDYLSDAERSEIVEEVANQLLEIPRKHFPRTSNLEYAILKAHLIVEFAITQFIRCSSYILVTPKSLRLTFAQKLEIAVLFGFGVGCPTTVPSLELLNRIRNQAAHHFDIDYSLVNELIRINTKGLDVSALTDRQRISYIRKFCYAVCGQTAGVLKMIIVVTSRGERPI